MKIENLENTVKHQIRNNFGLNNNEEKRLELAIGAANRKSKKCFEKMKNQYYRIHDEDSVNAFHSGQYTVFLYWLSNIIAKANLEDTELSSKLYYLNKMLNGLDCYYEVELPSIFSAEHAVGSVIGRAKYGNMFSFCQMCTVGNNNSQYPVIGNNVKMYSGSKILGNCNIGNNVIISANSYVLDQNIPSNSIYFGQPRDNAIKSVSTEYIMDHSPFRI